MATYTIPQRFALRRGTYTELYQRNEVLKSGEVCFETHDTDGVEYNPWKWKVGDGTTAWNDLEYEEGDGTTSTSTDGQVPTLVASGETFTVAVNRQVLFSLPITVDGLLVVDGYLVEV